MPLFSSYTSHKYTRLSRDVGVAAITVSSQPICFEGASSPSSFGSACIQGKKSWPLQGNKAVSEYFQVKYSWPYLKQKVICHNDSVIISISLKMTFQFPILCLLLLMVLLQ